MRNTVGVAIRIRVGRRVCSAVPAVLIRTKSRGRIPAG
jgi:hypothetical protein